MYEQTSKYLWKSSLKAIRGVADIKVETRHVVNKLLLQFDSTVQLSVSTPFRIASAGITRCYTHSISATTYLGLDYRRFCGNAFVDYCIQIRFHFRAVVPYLPRGCYVNKSQSEVERQPTSRVCLLKPPLELCAPVTVTPTWCLLQLSEENGAVAQCRL